MQFGFGSYYLYGVRTLPWSADSLNRGYSALLQAIVVIAFNDILMFQFNNTETRILYIPFMCLDVIL
jgi:hypothetical protein